VVAVPVAILVAAFVGSRDGSSSSSPSPTATPRPAGAVYEREVEAAFSPLTGALPELANAISEWGDGTLDDAGFTARLDAVEPVFDGTLERVQALDPHPAEALAVPLLLDTADLYVLAIEVHRAAVDETDPALRTSLDLLARRLRVLGDRSFDRSRDLTAGPLEVTPGIDLRQPVEIPEWRSLGLAAGPPLTEVSPLSDELPLLRRDDRPSQSRDDFVEAVGGLDVPTTAEIAAAMTGDPAAAGALADRLTAAADGLRDMAVPAGDRQLVDRLGLGWLVLADAARAAQVAALTGSDPLATVADRLLDLGSRAELSSTS